MAENTSVFSQSGIDQLELLQGQKKGNDNAFMRECLSKAMQWCSPNLIRTKGAAQGLEKLLNTQGDGKYKELAQDAKLEVLLLEIQGKGFEIMRECLNTIQKHVPEAVNDIWELYHQYLDAPFDNFLCTYCKIRCRVDIKHCSRYLHRQGIISDHLHKVILYAGSKVATQEDLWNELEKECDKYHTQRHVVEAIYSGLESQGDAYEYLLAELENWFDHDIPKFKCRCQEECSKMFTPRRYIFTTRRNIKSHDGLDGENQNPTINKPYSGRYRVKQTKKKRKLKSLPIKPNVLPENNKNCAQKDDQSLHDYTVISTREETAQQTRHDEISQYKIRGEVKGFPFTSEVPPSYARNEDQIVPEVTVAGTSQNTAPTTRHTKDMTKYKSRQTFVKQKRKVDTSTNIYNIYSIKGHVSLGNSARHETNKAISDGSESDTNEGAIQNSEENLTSPRLEAKDETLPKRFKYSQLPPAMTNPTSKEISDVTPEASSSDNLENCSLTRVETKKGQNTLIKSSERDVTDADQTERDKLLDKFQILVHGCFDESIKHLAMKPKGLLRQLSLPPGY